MRAFAISTARRYATAPHTFVGLFPPSQVTVLLLSAPRSSQLTAKASSALAAYINDVAAVVRAMAQGRRGPADIRKFNATVPVAEVNVRRRTYCHSLHVGL